MYTQRVSNIDFNARIKDIPALNNIAKREINLATTKLKGNTAIIGADVYTPSNRIAQQDLLFHDNKLVAINDFDETLINEPIQYIIADGKTVAPAILDEHIHGGYGVNFHSSGERQIRGLLRRLANEGTGGVVATTLPGGISHIRKQIQLLSRIIENPKLGEAKIYGIHLEGPFLSPEKSGIHPKRILLEPTVENFERLEPKHISIVTFAPERYGGAELAEYLQSRGIIASAGHTMATAQDIVDCGIKQVTHVLNAMNPFHHRNLTVANEALWNNAITTEMNADQSLLPAKTMDILMRLKPKDKLVLISDALPEAGLKDDFYMNHVRIHVKDDWTAISDDGILAGSMQFLHNLAKKLITTTQMTFKDFIRYASVNPSKNLHVENDFRIKEGLTPNFTVWDNKTLSPEKTFVK